MLQTKSRAQRCRLLLQGPKQHDLALVLTSEVAAASHIERSRQRLPRAQATTASSSTVVVAFGMLVGFGVSTERSGVVSLIC
jgi:hypothetical protein